MRRAPDPSIGTTVSTPPRMPVTRHIRTALATRGVAVESFNATLLFDPSAIRSKAGTPFKVFTPFWRTLSTGPEPEHPLPAPTTILGIAESLRTRSSFQASICCQPAPTGPAASAKAGRREKPPLPSVLHVFLDEIVQDYRTGRDRPGRDGTSRLSPYLHWGEISPRQVWHAAKMRPGTGIGGGGGGFPAGNRLARVHPWPAPDPPATLRPSRWTAASPNCRGGRTRRA